MLLCCVDYLKRNSKMKNNEQHIMPFIERLLDGAEVEWKPLGEVAELKRGTSITKKDFNGREISCYFWWTTTCILYRQI